MFLTPRKIRILHDSEYINVSGRLHAEVLNWSFMEHPHPGYLEKTPAEEEALEVAREMGGSYVEGCASEVRAAFLIYLSRYPKFAELGTREDQFRAWKYHIVSDGSHNEEMCIVQVSFSLISDMEGESDISFCGRFSGPPDTVADRAFFEVVSDLRTHAILGKDVSVYFLLLLNDPYWKIELNPDVEYYVRKWLDKVGVNHKDLTTEHLEPKLTPARLQFVDQAVANDDLKAVLDTTPPCGPTY